MPTEDPTKSDVPEQKIQETEKAESETLSEDRLKSISGGVTSPGHDAGGGVCVF
jgi:hypothetical protein